MRRRTTISFKAFLPAALMLGVLLLNAHAVFAQQFTLVSSASDGTPASPNGSGAPSISADGRFVAFVSSATNLVPGDTNQMPDVFVKDRLTGATTRVSVATGGGQITNGALVGLNPQISANGRFVMFQLQDNLLPEDTNLCEVPRFSPQPCADVYLHDRETGTTTAVSVSSAGTTGDTESQAIDISADGRFVLFRSSATNLVPNDTNAATDLFLRDRQTSTTTRVGVDLNGGQFPGHTTSGRMSADGRVLVYAGGVLSVPGLGALFLQDRETGAVSILSTAFPAMNLPAGYDIRYYTPDLISADGRIITATERAVGPSLGLSVQRQLVHDRVTGRTVTTEWRLLTSFYTNYIHGLSGDGRTIVTSGPNAVSVLRDRINGFEETVPSTGLSGLSPSSISGDGRFFALATKLPADTDQQIYVYDRDSGDGDGMPSAWETTFGLNPTNLTDANADADLDGVTNLQEYLRGTHPNALASATRYFAEGAANAFFTTRMAAMNPGNDPAAVVFRFLGSNGDTSSVIRTIAARSRITLELQENGLAPANDFSTVIESNQLVVVDRTMTWDKTGYGAHAETAILAPSTTWYLAEGATHGAFDLFYLLQNPNDTQAHVTINYLRQAPLAPVSKTYTVDPNSRKTIPVDAEGPELDAVDTAAAITSDLPIVVERAMYSTRPGQPAFAAGHGAAGVTAPALRWFLAEGATGNFFDLYVLVGNPNTTKSDLTVTYLLPAGQPFTKDYSVGPQQRLTIYPQDEDTRLANTPVSVIVESKNNQPIVVERAMWWPKGEWYEAHVSAGATTTGTRWALADGEVSDITETYILIANTSTTAGTATVTLLEEGGTPVPIVVDLQPSSRVNVPVSVYLPAGSNVKRRFGALIETTGAEIVVERAMYSNVGGITWSAGTAALGTRLQ